MSKYKFKKDSRWWSDGENRSIEDFMHRGKRNEKTWGEAVEQFFAIPQVQKWIENNDWEMVFNEWEPLSPAHGLDINEPKRYRQWIADVLGLFLSLMDIDFMSYLSDIYVEHMFRKENYEYE